MFVPVGKTSKGKVIGYKKNPDKIGWEICFQDGGQVPADLHGLFTDERLAIAACQAYLAKREETEKKKAEKKVK